MKEEVLQQYINNNESISRLFEENEKIIREAGYKPPNFNFAVEREKRVNVPSGYIRTSGEFWNKYHLDEIVDKRNVRNNISYALQLSDYYNFILNRFNVWGSIETMLYKQAFINIVSIIEALILESSTRINLYCQKCKKIGKCKNNICKFDRENMKKASERLQELGVLKITEAELKRLIELYDYRNKIHIRLNEQNEFLDRKFDRNLYNETIEFMKKIDDCLWKEAVPLYNTCIGFENK